MTDLDGCGTRVCRSASTTRSPKPQAFENHVVPTSVRTLHRSEVRYGEITREGNNMARTKKMLHQKVVILKLAGQTRKRIPAMLVQRRRGSRPCSLCRSKIVPGEHYVVVAYRDAFDFKIRSLAYCLDCIQECSGLTKAMEGRNIVGD